MPIQKTEGLKGLPAVNATPSKEELVGNLQKDLRGWKDLSIEERGNWLDAHPAYRKATFNQMVKAYDNQRFIDTYGPDAFKAADKEYRDQYYRAKKIDDAFNKWYGDVESRQDNDEWNAIQAMSPEGRLALMESGWKNAKEQKEEKEKRDASIEAIQAQKEVQSDYWLTAGMNRAKTRIERKETETNEAKFQKAVEKDNAWKLERVAPLVNEIQKDLLQKYYNGEYDEAHLKELFDKIAIGSKETIDDGFGGTRETVDPGSAYYRMFKDRHELANLTVGDLIKYISEYQALSNAGDKYAAITNLEGKMQNYIADNQNIGDWASSAFYSIATKTAANFANGILALDMLASGATNGAEGIANRMANKDASGNGEDNAKWRDPKYWEGVDQFGTFSPDLIRKIYENGGISPYKWQNHVGQTASFQSVTAEGVAMMGYMASQYLQSLALGGLGNAVSKGLGASMKAAGATVNAVKAMEAGIEKFMPYAVSVVNALGISEAYAKGTYDAVLQKNQQFINSQMDWDAKNYTENIINGDKNKKFLFNGKETTVNQLVNQRVQGMITELMQAYPDAKPSDFNIEQLRKNAEAELTGVLTSNYRNDKSLWKNDYDADNIKATESAVTAFMTDFTIEMLRMSAANLTFRKFLMTKGQREALAKSRKGGVPDNSVVVTTPNGEMAAARTPSFFGIKNAGTIAALKNVRGGFHSNYMDDVTVAFADGFGSTYFNSYFAQKYEPEDYNRTIDAVSLFLNAVNNGITSANRSLYDKQTWLDGLVGALGSVVSILPRVTALGKNKNLRKYNEIDINNRVDAINRERVSALTTALEGTNGDEKAQSEIVSDSKYAPMSVNEYLESEQFNEDVQSGKIRKKGVAARINEFVRNPILQDYVEANEQVDQFAERVRVANEVIKEKGKELNDIFDFIITPNNKVRASNSDENTEADTRDLKAIQGFHLIQKLDAWSKDPILSQSTLVKDMTERLNSLANGEVTEKDIEDYISDAENTEDLSRLDPSINVNEYARQQIQKNANKLLQMQKIYDEAQGRMRMKDFDALRVFGPEVVDKILTEFAYSTVMEDNRVSRIGQMEQEISGRSTIAETISDIARYGSKEGAADFARKHTENAEALEKEAEEDEAIAKKSRGSKKRAFQLRAKELRERAEGERKEAKAAMQAQDSDYERVLSADEIIALSPMDRAMMLDPENMGLYSKNQREVIKQVRQRLEERNPNLLDMVQDIAILQERNKALRASRQIMKDNPVALADFIEYMESRRASTVADVIVDKTVNDFVEAAKEMNDSQYIVAARDYSVGYLERVKSKILALENPPISEFALNDAIKIAQVYEDTNSVIRATFESREEGRKYANLIMALTNQVTSYEELMRELENLIDINSEGNTQYDAAKLEEIANALVKLGHVRDATKIEERKKRKAEQEKLKDGANFGWSSFKVGDTIYNKKGTQGTVVRFAGRTMFVKWENSTKESRLFSEKHHLETYKTKPGERKNPTEVGTVEKPASTEKTKQGTQPEEKKEQSPAEPPKAKPEVKPTPEPAVETLEMDGSGFEVGEDGGIVTKNGEQKLQDEGDKGGDVIETTDEEPENAANNESLQALEGVNLGNPLYKYEPDPLKNTAKGERTAVERVPIKKGGAFDQLKTWEKAHNTDIQGIIDNELGKIVADNPNINVRFMYQPECPDIIFLALEYTNAVKKHHNETKYGGVFTTEDGKQYLTIGNLGFAKESVAMRDNFNFIKERVIGAAEIDGSSVFVHPAFYTQVSSMLAGRIVDKADGEERNLNKRLDELIEDESANPHGLTLEDMSFGIMYTKDKFKIETNEPDGVVYPPRRTTENEGLVFALVPGANGAYVPISLYPTLLSQLVERSELRSTIDNLIRGVYTDTISTQERLNNLKVLAEYLVFTNDHKVFVREGKIIFKEKGLEVEFPAGDTNQTQILERFGNFRVNISSKVLNNTFELRRYAKAGALTTSASKLGTINASYTVYQVDSNGKPIITESKPAPSVEPVVTRTPIEGTKIQSNGREYTYVAKEKKYYDSEGNEIINTSIRDNLSIKRYIDNHKVKPIHTTKDGKTSYYTIPASNGSTVVVKRTGDTFVKLTPEQADRLEERLYEAQEKRLAEQKAKEELARQKTEEERLKKEGVPTRDIPSSDLTVVFGRIVSSKGDLRQAAKGLPEEFHRALSDANQLKDADPGVVVNGLTRESAMQTLINVAEKYKGNPAADAILEKVTSIQQRPEVKQETKIPAKPKEKSSGKKKEDVTIAGKETLVREKNPDKSANFVETFRSEMRKHNSEITKAVMEAAKRWGVKLKNIPHAEQVLAEHGLSLETVTNMEDFLENLKNCK